VRGASAWSERDGAALEARFRRELEPHFQIEERVLLPALRKVGQEDLVRRTEDDHAAIRALARRAVDGERDAALTLGEQLTRHVRFEERTLFQACQDLLPEEILDELARRAPKRA